MSAARAGLLALALSGFTGCIGSILTRGQSGADLAGEYPFRAVVQDVEWIAEGPSYHSIAGPVCILFLPFDLMSDAVLFPFDLLLWPLGFSRFPPKGR